MKKGVSAIIKADNGSNYFLILHRNKNWKGWEFPKGGIEEGETPEQAVIRELKEETGLPNIKIHKKFDFKREFTNNGETHSFDIFFVESNMNYPVNLEKTTHDNFLWATPKRVLELLYWDEEKEAFQEAVEIIKNL